MHLNQKQFGEVLGISSQRVGMLRKAERVVRGDDEKYDLADPVNRAYLREHFHREFLQFASDPEQETDDDSLTAEKMREEIRYLQARALKVELQNAELKRGLVPADLVDAGFGAFGAAIRTNILTLAAKIARGNKTLEELAAKYIKQSVEKSIEQASATIEELTSQPIVIEVDDE